MEKIPIIGLGLLCNFLKDAAAKINFAIVSDVLNIKVFNKFISRELEDSI